MRESSIKDKKNKRAMLSGISGHTYTADISHKEGLIDMKDH